MSLVICLLTACGLAGCSVEMPAVAVDKQSARESAAETDVDPRPYRAAQDETSTTSVADDTATDDGPGASRGTLRGRFIYDGTPPEPETLRFEARQRALFVADVPNAPAPAEFFSDGIPDESLLVGPEGGLQNVVVWVYGRDIAGEVESGTTDPVRIRVEHGRIEPHVIAYEADRPIDLENKDPYVYNFHASPEVGSHWATVLVPVGGIVGSRGGRYVHTEPVTPGRPFRPQPHPVKLTNDKYSWFNAWILPLWHPYYAVTDEAGRFEIPNLPPGEWQFAFWHERAGWLETDRISQGKLTLTIAEGVHDLGDVHVDPDEFEADEAESVETTGHGPRNPAQPAVQPRSPNPPQPTTPAPADSAASATNDQRRPRVAAHYDSDGFTPLHRAAQGGRLAEVRELLAGGADIDVPQRTYRGAPLQYAASAGHADVVELLLESGAEIDSVDSRGRTPLIWAAQSEQSETARLLIDAGADVNHQATGGWTPLHYAARDGNTALAQLLIDAGADLDRPNSQGLAPLHLAAEAGRTEAVRMLLDGGADRNARDGAGRTAADRARNQGHKEIVTLLAGEGSTPSKPAEEVSEPPAVESSDPTPPDEPDVPTTSSAADSVDVTATNENGQTALHGAVIRKDRDLVEQLLEEGADVNAADRGGFTPISRAVIANDAGIVELLLEHGADPDATYSTGTTVLESALAANRLEVAAVLLERGARVDRPGETPQLMRFADRGKLAQVELLIPYVDVDARDEDEQTALIRAAERGRTEVVAALIEAGADVDATAKRGWTALHHAVDRGDQETAQLLVDRGADLTAKLETGETPEDLDSEVTLKPPEEGAGE